MIDPLVLTRRELLRRAAAAAAAMVLPAPLAACGDGRGETAAASGTGQPALRTAGLDPDDPDRLRLHRWVRAVQEAGMAESDVPLGITAAAVGEQALGTPYLGFALEEYIKAGGDPARTEPLSLSLTYFDCVSLVESCLAIARVARASEPATWEAFAREMERMRYRGGEREDYLSRLHYFSEWIHDNQERGLVRDLGQELGGVPDRRPLRFMTANRDAYPALAHPEIYAELQELERGLDDRVRWVVPTERIPAVSDQLRTGDILAFATAIDGLDVTHAAYAYRDPADVLRVLHAPLSGGVVEITEHTLPEYVRAIRRATGIMVARPE